jgi:hypothetical protein
LGGLDQPRASTIGEFEHTTSASCIVEEYGSLDVLDFLNPLVGVRGREAATENPCVLRCVMKPRSAIHASLLLRSY